MSTEYRVIFLSRNMHLLINHIALADSLIEKLKLSYWAKAFVVETFSLLLNGKSWIYMFFSETFLCEWRIWVGFMFFFWKFFSNFFPETFLCEWKIWLGFMFIWKFFSIFFSWKCSLRMENLSWIYVFSESFSPNFFSWNVFLWMENLSWIYVYLKWCGRAVSAAQTGNSDNCCFTKLFGFIFLKKYNKFIIATSFNFFVVNFLNNFLIDNMQPCAFSARLAFLP